MIDSAGRSRGSRGQKLDPHIATTLQLDSAIFSKRMKMEEDRMGGEEERRGHSHSCARRLNRIPPILSPQTPLPLHAPPIPSPRMTGNGMFAL